MKELVWHWYYLFPLVFAVTLHEAAHAWVAMMFGDPTPAWQRRNSINPWHHIDIIGTVIVPIVSLALVGLPMGWARTVYINESILQPRKTALIAIALAGPAANILQAGAWAAIMFVLALATDWDWGMKFAMVGALINTYLALFNLIPWLPFDGGRALFAAVNEDKSEIGHWMLRAEWLGMPFAVALLIAVSVWWQWGPIV